MSSYSASTSAASSTSAFEFYSAQTLDAFSCSDVDEKVLPELPLAELLIAELSLPEAEATPRFSSNASYTSRPPSYASSSESLPSFESLQSSPTSSETPKSKRSVFSSLFSWKRSSEKNERGEKGESEKAPPPYVSEEDLAMMAYRIEQMDALFGGAAIKGF